MRAIHLVGSIGLANEREVFGRLAEILGDRAPRYPDGESGERNDWIGWQRKVFSSHPQFEPANEQSYRKDGPTHSFRIRKGVQALTFESVGYAKAAIESYATFAQLKSQGVIPAGTRFLVALPTPTAVVTSFVAAENKSMVEPAYERTLQQEVRQIVAAIPNDQLAIQWDVCFEILALDGAFPLHFPDALQGSLSRLERLSAGIPEPVELGYHLCYGDPSHKHIQEPKDTASAVAFSNGICAQVPRSVQWIHLPVPRDRADAKYFAPLRGLQLQPSTELVLGLVHLTDGVEGAKRRMKAAGQYISEYGIATECGFGRRDARTIPDLLRVHRQIAEL